MLEGGIDHVQQIRRAVHEEEGKAGQHQGVDDDQPGFARARRQQLGLGQQQPAHDADGRAGFHEQRGRQPRAQYAGWQADASEGQQTNRVDQADEFRPVAQAQHVQVEQHRIDAVNDEAHAHQHDEEEPRL